MPLDLGEDHRPGLIRLRHQRAAAETPEAIQRQVIEAAKAAAPANVASVRPAVCLARALMVELICFFLEAAVTAWVG